MALVLTLVASFLAVFVPALLMLLAGLTALARAPSPGARPPQP